jgi:delta 1-pyrroline-5-carboxylate dehydrogenase
MSETAAEAAATGTTETNQETEQKPTETVEFWKAKAREQEKRAKDNKAAADELAQLRETQKSSEQKAADREAAAIKRAEEAEARALRREIALDPAGDGKSAALSAADAALLDDLTDEDAMRRLAARLAANAERKPGNRVPTEGKTTSKSGDDKLQEFTRNLFDRGD